MSHHTATITWKRQEESFTDNLYSRAHTWQFDGGTTVPASSSPQVVPPPYSDAASVDPEEAFVAALSSCHMLTFLFVASKRGFVVDAYHDEAVGKMAKNGAGRLSVARVTLAPNITFAGDVTPSTADVETMHQEAHEACYLANSVKTDVVVLAQGVIEPHRPE